MRSNVLRLLKRKADSRPSLKSTSPPSAPEVPVSDPETSNSTRAVEAADRSPLSASSSSLDEQKSPTQSTDVNPNLSSEHIEDPSRPQSFRASSATDSPSLSHAARTLRFDSHHPQLPHTVKQQGSSSYLISSLVDIPSDALSSIESINRNALALHSHTEQTAQTRRLSLEALPALIHERLDIDSSTPGSQDSIGGVSSAAISVYSLPPPVEPLHTEPRVSSAPAALTTPILHDYTPAEVLRAPRPIISISAASPDCSPTIPRPMPGRKIWVKRPGQSATMVAIKEDDLVDDVRDKILAKYANSLGKSFDSPDVTLRIVARSDMPRSAPAERLLGPEEDMCRTLDMYYPSGQTVTDALVIDIPVKKTPRPSPGRGHHGSQGHVPYHALEEFRPHESGTDYFPPMPAVVQPMAGANGTVISHVPSQILQLPDHARAMSVLGTGQVPPLPSPGAAARKHRPKYGRQHTSSPTLIAHPSNPSAQLAMASPSIMPTHMHRPQRPRNDSNATERPNLVPAPPPLPTPPAADAVSKISTPPTPLARAERPRAKRPKTRNPAPTQPETGTIKINNAIAALLDGSVPPINVLIVEDNIINLKLLEAFMKRLKVRWSTAMNGQIAVNKWKQGGFHLVLMDIQLPIMSGLEATKEIRRLESVNGIGIFSSSTPTTPMAKDGAVGDTESVKDQDKDSAASKASDKLDKSDGLFKSPVIIVALTASSLQSDRHEALAAGCNDFLTKPVNFMYMERKVKEWGCMQALIDFDGWRKWKDFSSDPKAPTAGNKTTAGKDSKAAIGDAKQTSGDAAAKARDKKVRRDKRVSSDLSQSGVAVAVGGDGHA